VTGRRRWLQVALLVAPVLVLAAGAWARHWMSDDGFINLRVVSMIKSGHGPVFNAGERVEAGTSPLWVWTLAFADVITPFRLEWVAVVTGIGLSVAGVAFAIAGSRLLAGPRDRAELLVPVGAAVVVALAPMWTFASSGLENGLTYAWLGACLWTLARWARPSREGPTASPVVQPSQDRGLSSIGAVLIGLGPLVRPELALVSAVLLAAVHLDGRRHDTWRDRRRTVATALALPVAYQLFRMGYYASLVPNPAVAKEASRARWDVGWAYLRAFARPYALWLPLTLLAFGAYPPRLRSLRGASSRRALVTVAFAVAGLVHGAYIVRVGGDFMYARLLLPSLFAIAAPVAVLPVRRTYALGLAVIPWAVVCAIGLRTPADDAGAFGTGQHHLVTTDDLGWERGQRQRAWFTGDGVYFAPTRLDALPPPGAPHAEVATYGVGIGSYALGPDVYVLDLLGLGDAFTSHLKLTRRGLIAHEKPLPAPWIVARLTARGTNVEESVLTLPHGFGARPIDDPEGRPFAARVADARATLRCRPVVHFTDSYRSSLTAGRFAGNIGRSVTNWGFRIPPEPADARARFCP
jgi:arabinofuranosyltransferase